MKEERKKNPFLSFRLTAGKKQRKREGEREALFLSISHNSDKSGMQEGFQEKKKGGERMKKVEKHLTAEQIQQLHG